MLTSSAGLYGIGATIINLINNVLVPVVFAIAFIVFLYGALQAFIVNGGEEAKEKGKNLMLWGLIGFFIMLSLWGLVNVVVGTFGLNQQYQPRPTPTFTPQQ